MRYLFYTLILIFASPVFSSEAEDLTLSFEAYLTELVQTTVMSDAELIGFADQLKAGSFVNPINCETKFCNSQRLIHHMTLADYVDAKDDLDLSALKKWLENFLVQRGHQREERAET